MKNQMKSVALWLLVLTLISDVAFAQNLIGQPVEIPQKMDAYSLYCQERQFQLYSLVPEKDRGKKAVLSFEVLPTGNLDKIVLEESSGSVEIDFHSLFAAATAIATVPVPTPPSSKSSNRLYFFNRGRGTAGGLQFEDRRKANSRLVASAQKKWGSNYVYVYFLPPAAFDKYSNVLQPADIWSEKNICAIPKVLIAGKSKWSTNRANAILSEDSEIKSLVAEWQNFCISMPQATRADLLAFRNRVKKKFSSFVKTTGAG